EKEILLADIDGYHISKLADFNKYVEKVRIHQASESFLYWGDENILIFRDKHLNLKFRKKYTAKIYTAGFYNHSSQFYVLTYSGDLSIHDFQGNTIKKFIIRESPYTMKTFQIHPDDKYFLYSWKKQTRTYNTNPESLYFSDLNGSIIRKINLDKEISISVNKVSPDGKYFIYNTDENRLIVINLISGKKHSIDYAEKRNPREQVILFHMAVDPESKKLSVLHFETGKIKEYSITGKLLNEYSTGISNSGGTLSYNHDGSLLISGNLSGPIIIFNTINKEAVTYIRKNDRWIIYSNDGYFDASRNIGDLVMMSDGKNIFSVDQFAIYNNRPDIILKKLNIYNSDKIDHYYSHFKQRLKRLSMKEKRFSQVSFAPKTIIKSENRNKNRYIINLEFKDSHSGLHNYNVYVNGVPISGIEGKSLKGRHASVKEEILLTPGKNLIEISCVNNDGIESVRLLRNKNYKSEKKGNLYFLGFGISSYKNKDYNLKFASKDISDFSKFLSNFKNKYSNVYARTYLNSEVSHENFIKSKMFLKNAKENDTVILFLAGHGMYDRTGEAKYYFLTYESDLKNLSRKSIPFHEIEELIADNGARRKLVLLDTCESGEVEESYWKESLKFANSRGFEVRKNKSAKTVKKKRRYLFNKNRFIYNDLLRRTGAVIFSSSRGGELSFESIQHRNGFFTNALMDGLKGKADLNSNGAITIDELRVFVTKTVSKQTENHQNPTIDRDNIHQQISFPVQK
ncbi:MAG: caspase family protein, partial [Spirochaetia bacterium]|nr:caspase family protein [Spirochaetia bacterium]